MKQKLKEYVELIHDPALRKTCETLFHYENFFLWPASLSFHHAYEGGLIAHTLEVADIAGGILNLRDGELTYHFGKHGDSDVLIAAVLWHDLMKIEEYILGEFCAHPENEELLPKRRLLKYEDFINTHSVFWHKDPKHTELFGHHSHIIASAQQFMTTAINCGVKRELRDAVNHCILAHHGPVKEWGSPVAPASFEAIVLHQADLLSAKFGATKEVAP